MTIRTRRAVPALLLVIACLTLPASASHGSTTHEPIFAQATFTDTITDFPCFEGIPVTMTGTDTIEGRLVQDGEHDRGYHFTETIDYRVDFADGRHAEGGVVNHFTVSNNMQRPLTTVTSTQLERATLYTPDGLPAGEMTLHIASHKKFSDADGDRFPDPDEIIVAVDNFKVTECP